MRVFTLFFLLAVMLTARCTSREARSNSWRIAYNVRLPDTTRDNYEVFIMNMDGTDKRNVTSNPDVAWIYEAVDDSLLFISDRDTCYRCYFLYKSGADGSQPRRITDLQLEDSWMSAHNHGRELVVTGRIGRAIRFQMFLVDTWSGTYRQLTTDTAARYGDPVFSPDGTRIAFSYKKDRRDRSAHEELFIMNDDGSGMRQLTHYPENNSSAREYGYRAGAARWHPTEDFISYVSLQDGRHSIFAITPDGSRQWKLTNHEFAEGWHDWSPDGKWLVFNSSDWKETQYQITLMNWETKELRQLTDSTYKAQQSPVFVGR
jgi:TolB protein